MAYLPLAKQQLGLLELPTQAIRKKIAARQFNKLDFVISSHGGQIAQRWAIPPRVALHFFTQPGEILYCDKVLQTQVCAGTHLAPFSYYGPKPGQPYRANHCLDYNYILTPDYARVANNNVGFHSGVVLCPNTVLAKFRYQADSGVWLSDLVDNIVNWCEMAGWPKNKMIHITCLFCRDNAKGLAGPVVRPCPVAPAEEVGAAAGAVPPPAPFVENDPFAPAEPFYNVRAPPLPPPPPAAAGAAAGAGATEYDPFAPPAYDPSAPPKRPPPPFSTKPPRGGSRRRTQRRRKSTRRSSNLPRSRRG